MSSPLIDIRDQVYTRLLLKKNLNQFLFNGFVLQKTWIPKQRLEDLATNFPQGIVYVVGGTLGDRMISSRASTRKAEYSVKIGYQRVLSDPYDVSVVDGLIDFVEQLDLVMAKEIDLSYKILYSRTEFEKDEDGVPFTFIRMDEISTFESYSTVYYHTVLP